MYKHKSTKQPQNSSGKLKKFLLLALPIFGLTAGLYLLLLVMTPSLNIVQYKMDDNIKKKFPEGNYLQIEKLDLIVPIGKTEKALDGGSWMRYADERNPEIGGNTIISGHRFRLSGWTPQTIAQSSPFYHIDKLKQGDTVRVRFNGKDYNYRIHKTYQVKPSAVEIEANTSFDKLTLYTCTLSGSSDGRVVIDALPVTSDD